MIEVGQIYDSEGGWFEIMRHRKVFGEQYVEIKWSTGFTGAWEVKSDYWGKEFKLRKSHTFNLLYDKLNG